MKSNSVTLPSTPNCFVHYRTGGVLYRAFMETPKDHNQLQAAMLTRKVGMSQVEKVEPIQPRGEIQRGHPAQHRLVQYATID